MKTYLNLSLVNRVAAKAMSQWNKFLKEKYEGGKKKVPNPNPKTNKSRKEVSLTTALRDEGVANGIRKEFQEWVKSPKEDKDTKESPKDTKESPKEPSKESPKESPKETKESPKDTKKTPKKPATSAPKVEPKETPKESPKEAPKKPAPKAPKESPKEAPKKPPKGPTLKHKDDKVISGPTKTSLTGILAPSESKVKESLAKHKATFTKVLKNATSEIARYKKAENFSPRSKKLFDSLSKEEQTYHVMAAKAGQHFLEKVLSEEESFLLEDYISSWTGTSACRRAMALHGLAASMGVSGTPAPSDGDRKKDRSLALKDKKLQDVIQKTLDYQRAFFEHLGLKELTVFRGVKGQIDDAKPGDEVTLKTRELSSFSTDPRLAFSFGKVVSTKVPVDRIFFSPAIHPGLGAESPQRLQG